MLKNYFKGARRNLVRDRQFNFLSLAGLMVAVAVFSLLFKVVKFERTYDRFYQDAKRIFRVVSLQTRGEGQQNCSPENPVPVASELALDVSKFQGDCSRLRHTGSDHHHTGSGYIRAYSKSSRNNVNETYIESQDSTAG